MQRICSITKGDLRLSFRLLEDYLPTSGFFALAVSLIVFIEYFGPLTLVFVLQSVRELTLYIPMSLVSHILALCIPLLSFVGAQFAKPSGLLFALDGANPERFAGINSWYLTGHTADADIDNAFQTMHSVSHSIFQDLPNVFLPM